MKLFIAISGLSLCAVLLAQQNSRPSQQNVAATIDRMNAGGKTQAEIAQYVFDTHGCKSCHVAGQDGKLGFTARGREIGKGFEGCVSMLSSMNLISQVSDDQRTPGQRKKAARFEEFGCTFCHKITPGKMGLTAVGAKLSHMHLGCVQVEQQLSAKKRGNQSLPVIHAPSVVDRF
jgi:cytochrome c551/c552